MGKFKEYDVTISRINTNGSWRSATYNVSHSMLQTWIESWLNDRDAVTISITGIEAEDA